MTTAFRRGALTMVGGLAVLCGCGGSDAGLVGTSYRVDSGSCTIRVGDTDESLTTSGELDIRKPGDLAPGSCEAVAVFRATTCSGCGPPRCQICLENVSGGSMVTAALEPATTDDFPVCDLVDMRGGASSDLFLYGNVVDGDFELDPSAERLTITADFVGEGSYGVTGSDRPAEGTCMLEAVPE